MRDRRSTLIFLIVIIIFFLKSVNILIAKFATQIMSNKELIMMLIKDVFFRFVLIELAFINYSFVTSY